MCKTYSFLLLLIISTIPTLKAQTLNHYFGNIHAHSSYSDGNQDSSTSMITKPFQDFMYAKNAQHIDFYGISEHNHYSAGMTNKANFHRGISDANSATVNGSFVALYGMEWGIISGGGHVIVYGYDSLLGWDSNDYDVYVAQNNYTGLWKKLNEHPGSFGYLAHPQSDDYNNLFINAADLSADNAIVGLAARSGPANSTNTSYSNPSTSNYISRYHDALKRGYHIGVGLDHDTHNSNFGKQTAGRMVVLAPSLTQADIIDAIRHMRFYSSDDWNIKVNFSIKNQPMGSTLTYSGTPTLAASVVDPDGENVSSIAVYYGVPGSGSNATVLTTVTNTTTLSYTHNAANNSTYYYYLKITQSDGNIVWTSPIWYTRNDALTNNPPVANFTSSTQTVCAGQAITFTDASTNGAIKWNWTLPGALPATSDNKHTIATYYSPGTYTVTLSSSNVFGTSNMTTQTISVIAVPNVIAVADTICAGETAILAASGADTYSWSTGSSNPTITVSPGTSAVYSVTGTTNGCSKLVSTYVLVRSCVGIEELRKGFVKLYPNPVNDMLTVDFKDLVDEKIIELYDALGKLLLARTSTDEVIKLDVSNFSTGVYALKVVLDGKLYATEKFIIERK